MLEDEQKMSRRCNSGPVVLRVKWSESMRKERSGSSATQIKVLGLGRRWIFFFTVDEVVL